MSRSNDAFTFTIRRCDLVDAVETLRSMYESLISLSTGLEPREQLAIQTLQKIQSVLAVLETCQSPGGAS